VYFSRLICAKITHRKCHQDSAAFQSLELADA
jgi:hypothetical protein